MDHPRPLLLGSGSPRRLDILRTLRVPVVAVPAQANETPRSDERPAPYLERVTREKLASVAHAAATHQAFGVLVADTIVLVDTEILGKPRDFDHAVEMLAALSGRAHEVWTRFVLASHLEPSIPLHEETVRSQVFFRSLTEGEIRGYAASGEGMDKAGAYAVQGLGSFAVRRIEGSYGNVVGLPACEVVAALLSTRLIDRFPL
ncbi:MAG: septum formation protein Maf [Deltaproteobacteria bacterium]|nr:septum formation protein Maf [Deltaproteobacteria bacterium]